MPSKLPALVLTLALLLGPLTPFARAEPSDERGRRDDAGTIAATAAANIFYVPGKLITCELSIGLGVLATVLTFGSVYSDTVGYMAKECGGRWWVETRDIPSPPRPSPTASFEARVTASPTASFEGRVTTSTDCMDEAGKASARVREPDKVRVYGEHYDACRAAKTALK
jgi:hypothetical protein